MGKIKAIKQLLILHELIEDVKEFGLEDDFKKFVDNNPDLEVEELADRYRDKIIGYACSRPE